MLIKDMFQRDINRYINGVVSVSDEDGVAQELEEYVVTRELQGHFATFFEAFEEGLASPERNTGVWVQGYFGSGKSHFLKMLSYLLENRRVNGRPAVEYFDDKFEDAFTYARVRRAAEVPTETILFNIDEKGAGYKEGDTSETAVLHAVARAFYDHLGFYGEDYKLARFEKMIDDKGRTAEFRAAFREATGEDWLETRDTYDFYGEEIARAANKAAGLSVRSIADWANGTDNVRIQPGDLVADINEYALRREREHGRAFRLVFMIDEMGQYLNGNVSRMLNLQTLMEKFGDDCDGRVWMVVTSQEAIDEMMNVVSMDFSKIQGRFGTRLSLSSSSVDEVIRQRVLKKNDGARTVLEDEFDARSAVLGNLFAFEESRGDLCGYARRTDFVQEFPFVGYQFTLMPDVLKEIRKHGYQGKSLSTGERSMLSSYQEAAQAVEGGTEGSLVPFWRFFDTLERELDHGVRQVFERCRRAAGEGAALRPFDVDVLKVLYLINYLDDIKPTAGNVAILLVDAIDVDMMALRVRTREALERLVHENYVARTGDRYSFLTDEEQDVAREIRDVQVDPSSVVAEVQHIVFEQVFKERKHRKGANDYPVDRYVDDMLYGVSAGGMKLNLVTIANVELADASDETLNFKSTGQAIVALDTANDYYDVLYNAARIELYARQRNVSALPVTKQRIVKDRQAEAAANRQEAVGLISEAITRARVSVDGRIVKTPAANAKQKLDAALDELVSCTFTKASLVDAPIENDAQLRAVLAGTVQAGIGGTGENKDAAAEVERHLEARRRMHQSVTMGAIQRTFQARPYGWREIDVAAVVARLWQQQRVALSVAGARILPGDPKAPAYLRKASEVDKVTVRRRTSMPAHITSGARNLLRELDPSAKAPDDEDGLVAAVAVCLGGRKERYAALLRRNYGMDSAYPGRPELERAVHLADEVLRSQADPEAFLKAFVDAGDDLLDNAEDLEAVQGFFETRQREFFDNAVRLLSQLHEERVYVEGDPAVMDAREKMAEIVKMERPYRRIQELPELTRGVMTSYGHLVSDKKTDLLQRLEASMDEIERYAKNEGVKAPGAVERVVAEARREVLARRDAIHDAQTCTKLDALGAQMEAWQEACLRKIDTAAASSVAPVQSAGQAARAASTC